MSGPGEGHSELQGNAQMKKLVFGFLAVAGMALLAGLTALVWTAQRSENPVGFEAVAARTASGQPIGVAIWYPTDARPVPTTLLGLTLMSVAKAAPVAGTNLPLVVLSHGNGGSYGSHIDLAMALASAGYVVAAPMHAGDNFQDNSGLRSPTFWSERNHQLIATIDFMLGSWRGREQVDATRVGAFGFSAGGFTVLTALGGRPDLARVAAHCAEHPEFVCDALKAVGSPLLTDQARQDSQFATDSRIKAAVVAAPGLGFSFPEGGFSDVTAPVQIWTGERDVTVPDPTNGARIRSGLPGVVEAHAVPHASHMSFLMPCGLVGPPALCRDEAPFDRPAFHQEMNAAVAAFFGRHLAEGTWPKER